MLWIILAIAISYLIGSIPTAYIFGRLLKGIDIRKFGSGNVGATNALRVLGKPAGITVLALDILKGFICTGLIANVLVFKTTYIADETLRVLLGLSCISGHNWTIFLRFKGGKGVATTFGALIGLAAKISSLKTILGLIILTWLIVFAIGRIVSLSSVLTAITLPIYMLLFKQSAILTALSIILAIFVIFRHKSNIRKILKGEESRLF